MIFEPYNDEMEVINNVHKYNENDYALIRLTSTMIEKNNIDANGLFRELLKNYSLVDYDLLANGGRHGRKFKNVDFISADSVKKVTMNFYKVGNDRSDPRFSIYGIRGLYQERKVNIGDLLYISVTDLSIGKRLVILNTTSMKPTNRQLAKVFGISAVTDSATRLIPAVKRIAQAGYHPNSKGKGKVSPKDVGDTLEDLLKIKTNNSQNADFENVIEIKAKTGKTMDTLFTLRPQFVGTPVEVIESKDRSRVSAFTRLYGYDSDKHAGYKSLYITIGAKRACQNTLGFYLEVNEIQERVELRKINNNGLDELTAYWTFKKLREELHRKHNATLWVKAETRVVDGVVEFKYYEASLSREPQFATFLSLIVSGGITYDWRGFTTPVGKYQGKNHGNAWRIKKSYRESMFGSMERIVLV